MRPWTRALLLVAAPIALFPGCGRGPSDPAQDPGHELTLHLVDGPQRLPTAFSVHVTPDGGRTLSACCADGACDHRDVTPLPQGLRVKTEAGPLTVVVKARGYRAAQARHSRPASEEDALQDALRMRLDPLAPPPATADYAAFFPADGGRELFASLAVPGSGESGPTLTVKFYIEGLDGTPEVYFQNTVRHPLHYNFVRDVLQRPWSLAEFEARTYSNLGGTSNPGGSGRQALAGSLVWRTRFSRAGDTAANPVQAPLTVEFFPSDDLTPAQALKAGLLLEERIQFPGPCGEADRIHYLPPSAAHETALAGHAAEFRAHGLRWITREALYRGATLQLLNPGEAYGTLRILSPDSLLTSPVSYRDIVILPRLPNAMPLVGGTITEEFQTPLSHVNVAARSRKAPNLALPGAATRPGIAALIGSLVRFKVDADTFLLEKADLADAERFWQGLNPETPAMPAADLASASLEPFARVSFADRARFGVKAANLAELSRLLPGQAPAGFAVPFARYADFLGYAAMSPARCDAAAADCAAEGRPAEACAEAAAYRGPFCAGGAVLRTFLDSLIGEPRFQADSRFREASLDGLRHLMRNIPVEAGFARALDALADSLFPGKRIRLRSSTNAEDLEDFSGAGLYHSTGADASGPEKPSDEIRKVWASVWNWQAHEERAYRRIDHRKVYMGVAVHPSFKAEAANGVLITRNLADPVIDGFYVNVQPGEASVTNPVDGSLPEIFTVAGGKVIRLRHSSLSPGAPVMSDAEAARLEEMAAAVQHRFASLYGRDPRDPAFALEIEFKLDDPGRAVVFKQARPFSPTAGR